jgi:hypothetical protein
MILLWSESLIEPGRKRKRKRKEASFVDKANEDVGVYSP